MHFINMKSLQLPLYLLLFFSFTKSQNEEFNNYTLLNSTFQQQINDFLFNQDPFMLFKRVCNNLLSIEKNACVKELIQMCNGVENSELWALEMIDATAKPQSGILYGNIMHIGNYDECIKVEKFTNGTNILGKYCQVQYSTDLYNQIFLRSTDEQMEPDIDSQFLQNMRMSFGLCIPKSCTAKLIQPIATEFLLSTNFSLTFDERFCGSKNEENLPIKVIIGLIIFGFFGVLSIISTLYDLLRTRRKSPYTELLTAFSFYSNGKKLFSTHESQDSLLCINGIKVISMMWIVLGHRYLYTIYIPLVNFVEYFDSLNNLETMFIIGASMAVDSFFTMSGLLLMYVYLNRSSKGHKISLLKLYLHRLLRLTPSLAMVIVFIVTLMDDMTSGPFWTAHDFFVTSCKKNWWSTLLYIQNYVNPNETCVGQSWYLAVETQLHFLAPIFLFNIVKHPKWTISGMALAGIASCVYAFILTWVNKYDASFIVMNTELLEKLYDPTHLRASPWIIGMLMGYVIFKVKNKKIHFSKISTCVLWVIALGIVTGIILYHFRFVNKISNSKYEISTVETALFNGFARSAWSLGLSLVIFLCISGNGGFINHILSLPIFSLLNKLNYSVYLLHLIVIMYFLGQKRTADYVSNIVNFHAFWGDFIYTIVLSIFWTLMFESPVIAIEKFLG